jgi:hypothetical protein
MEQVLYENMQDYFDVSEGKRQSKLQQAFTRRLLDKVRQVAHESGWTFSGAMVEKVLRDRIRCFYKTHLQNAKKRLVTLQKHPGSADHRSALRVYVRSARLGISVEESQLREPKIRTKYHARAAAPSRSSVVVASPGGGDEKENGGRGGGGNLPTVRRGEIFNTLQTAHRHASHGVVATTPSAAYEPRSERRHDNGHWRDESRSVGGSCA